MSLGERLIKENGKRKRGFDWLGGGEGEKMNIVRVKLRQASPSVKVSVPSSEISGITWNLTALDAQCKTKNHVENQRFQ